MLKNVTPLLTLAEPEDAPVLVRAAGMALDVCLDEDPHWGRAVRRLHGQARE